MENSSLLSVRVRLRHRTILRNIYMWMTLGLSLTALVAWGVSKSPAFIEALFGRGIVPILLLSLGIVILVFTLSRNIMRMSVGGAVGGFLLYSVLNGLLCSSIFAIYTKHAIFQAFAVSAGMFAFMSLWALTTRRDLSGWGHYLFMALIGLIITGVLGIFIGGKTYQFLYSAIGVVLFTALTAYDTQMFKRMSDNASADTDESDFTRLSILGALKLYLDFINMFLFMLRLFGRRN